MAQVFEDSNWPMHHLEIRCPQETRSNLYLQKGCHPMRCRLPTIPTCLVRKTNSFTCLKEDRVAERYVRRLIEAKGCLKSRLVPPPSKPRFLNQEIAFLPLMNCKEDTTSNATLLLITNYNI